MPDFWTTIHIILIIVAVPAMIVVLRLRKQSHARHLRELADQEVCEHLRPAMHLLLARGHVIRRVGQQAPEYPLEVHLQPPFDPAKVALELNLQPPVHLSDRNVLYCRDDACEIHPVDA